MPLLEIRYRTGRVETRELPERTALLVGQSAVNDIQVDADGVAEFHCRIGWDRKGMQVTAATAAGVQWNGSTVRNAPLSPGDIVRVGDVDIVILADGPGGPRTTGASSPPSSNISLKPLTAELEAQQASVWQPAPRAPVEPARTPLPSARAAARATPAVPGDLELLARAEAGSAAAGGPPSSEFVLPAPVSRETTGRVTEAPPPLQERVKDVLGLRPVRPGEQDPLRSPLVLGLGGGTLALLLAAATLWLILGRETAQKKYDTAINALHGGLYSQAIEGLETFLRDHPQHKQAEQARVALATARVEQAVAGSTPAWDHGLEALHEFIKENRDSEPFQNPQSDLRTFVLKSAERIALGAAETAKNRRQKPPLAISSEAAKLLTLYSPSDSPPAKQLLEIGAAVRAAEGAILRQETFDAAAQQMDAALSAEKVLAALDIHRRLLDRYGDFADFKPLRERLQKVLDLEQKLATREEMSRDAQNEERPAPLSRPPLSLVRRTRTRTDELSVGAAVFAVAEECCYGVDTVTGEPRWRRVIGPDPPFTPLAVAAATPAVLLYDVRHRDLLLVAQQTGALQWRQPLDEVPAGTPLVSEGQVFLPTAAGHLDQIDLATGRISVRLKLSQPVGPPVLSHSGERMYAAGRQGVLYVFTRRPLACERVVHLGHAAGAIQAPLLMMRSYLLVPENDRLQSCRLRVLDMTNEEQLPVHVSSKRIDGQVRQPAVLRGKQLFVPSDPERVAAFTVSETRDENALALAAAYQVQRPQGGPTFLSAGPDDQLWMTASALQRLTLTKDSLRADKEQIAVGLCTQPLQVIGDTLFLGRRLPSSRAVLFSKADRQRMTVQWQTALGAAVMECTGPSATEGPTTCVTTLGDLFQIAPEKLNAGGFELQPAAQLPLPAGLTTALRAARLSDGRLAVHCGTPPPTLWIVTGDGAAPLEHKLPQALQADPIALASGLLLPLPGRLKLLGQTAATTAVEDFLAPIAKQEPPRWTGLARVDETQAIAVNEQGRISRIELRTNPVPHLAEVAHWDAGSPIDLPLLVENGRILFADSQSRLQMLDASSLEPLAEVKLEKPVMRPPWLIGDRLYVEIGRDHLACRDVARKLEPVWQLPLEGASLSSAPQLFQDRLVIVLRDGRVLLADPGTGEVQKRFALEQTISFGPKWIGSALAAGTLDGSLIPLNGLLEGPK